MDPIKTLQAAANNPVVRDAVALGLEVRDAALRTQAAALSAMNLPSADDLNSIATHLRSISQRLELLEDSLAQVDERLLRLIAEVRSSRTAQESQAGD
jgi:hypothetical protein